MTSTTTTSPGAYWSVVVLACTGGAALCLAARRRPGPWRVAVIRTIGLVLVADVVTYTVSLIMQGTWSAATSLPLALCDVGVLVAAACWWQAPLLVELTYFWGLAATFQAVITPDLNVGFPHLVFFEYLVGHLGIVMAAVFLVVGLRLTPTGSRGSGVRHHSRLYRIRWFDRRADRGQLHIPASSARRMDHPATPRTMALVPVRCGRGWIRNAGTS